MRHADRVLSLVKSNARFLLLPNHSTHSDPQMMLEVQRRLRVKSSMMAAYDVFLRGRFQAWIMQRIGCFSIDREGSDSQAMKCAVELLVRGDRGLTLFAEGNVLLMNDRVAPFLGGAAFIGMRAQKKLGADKPIYAMPISMKFSNLSDCRDSVLDHVTTLESQLGIHPPDETSVLQRMRSIGLYILSRNLQQRGHMAPASSEEDLDEILEGSAIQIISHLEDKIGLSKAAHDRPLDRIRRVRSAIHQVRIDDVQRFDHRVATTWADEAILAVKILSYSGNYLSESPTLDRHCEVLEKLREDLIGETVRPIGDRGVVVQFGEPINLADHLVAMRQDSRGTLAGLTRTFERTVQQGLDEINASNELPGAMTF